MIKMKGNDGINMYVIYPFVRRYIDDYEYLIYRPKCGGEILAKKDECEIIK